MDEVPAADDTDDEEPETEDEPLEAFYGEDPIFGLKLSRPPAEAPRVPPRKARTATGALLTGIALGLRDVFDPEKKRDTIAIEQEAPTEPDEPQEYEIRLAASPRDSQAIYRPWVKDDETGPE
ncbi:MAG TPA: hypothetical protein VHF91_01240 [Acidimicrobiales bacterium]|nr:hypothetical protein [Acidimicrobiales bacterium]